MTKVIHGGDIYQYSNEITDFSSNINPLGLPLIAQEILQNSWKELERYPDLHYTALKSAIAEKLALSSADKVIVGNGAAEIIYLIGSLFAGKKVLLLMPTFGEYQEAIEQWGGTVETVLCQSDINFALPLAEILKRIPEVDGCILCNPNNPTGRLINESELAQIVKRAQAYGKMLILDEAFIDFVPNPQEVSGLKWLNEYPYLFIIRAFTKFFAMPGLRLGYGIGSEAIIKFLQQKQMPWSVNSLAAKIGERVLNDEEYISQSREWIERERNFLVEALKSIPQLEVYPTAANFILCKIKGKAFTAKDLQEQLLKDDILIRNAASFHGLDHYYFRVAIKDRVDNLKLVAALKKVL